MTYLPEARVLHAHRHTLADFLRQHFNYGRGAFDLHRSRAQRGEGSLKIEPLRFYAGLVAHPLRGSPGWRAALP